MLYIALEGIDGSGKTTQFKNLLKELSKKYRTGTIREPSNGPIGALIREQLSSNPMQMSRLSLEYLFAADRIHEFNSDYDIVLADRSVISSIAYSDFSPDQIKDINKYATKPDIVFFLDINPNIAMKRINKRLSENDYDKPEVYENIDKLKNVSDRYNNIIKNKDDFTKNINFYCIDATLSRYQITDQILTIIEEALTLTTLIE